jgi:response regulator RpfG family c-di-GMP phosphodiesterase
MNKSKGRILVVDDEIYIQEILKSTLQDAGFECVAVDNAESALSALAAEKFDIVFTDIRMPGKQGTELLRDVKSSYPNAVVIMITAVDSAGIAVESIRMGAYDYIVKPFNLDQVLIAAERGLDKIRLENANREYQRYLEQIAEERAAETRRLFYSTTQVFIRLLELKAPFNEGHALRVAEKARYVARELRMTEDGVRKVYLAALLHDVGMILVEDVLLNKQGALTTNEQLYMQSRISRIEDILKPVVDDEEVLKFIRHNREHYDGSGYPAGLKGNLIPLGARVISVAEAFDAIISGRPYRLPRSPQEAIRELARCSQSQFDPQVVTIFADLYDRIFRNQ